MQRLDAQEELSNATQKLAALKPQISIPEDRASVERKLMDLVRGAQPQCMEMQQIELLGAFLQPLLQHATGSF